ncbi:MAG TPA: hypothetical protein EYQ24_04060 [Bacteroidetes bacterium]|nr:hypothetical protein [Bacteroidota bacterium]
MATLLKRPTGVYAVQFYDATRTPKRKWVATSVRDHRSAEKMRRRWEVAYAEGRYDPWTQPAPEPGASDHRPRPRRSATLADARRQFLASRSHLALNTRLNYERVTGWFVDYTGSERSVGEVDARDIERWIGSLDVKPVTKANYVRHLRAWFRYCIQQRLRVSDPTEDVGLERVPRSFPKALRPEEVERVAAYAEAHCRNGRQRSSAWAAPFIRLGAETAMRRNELLHLTWDRVDLDAGHLTVACTDAFTTKSGAERRIPLSERAGAVLERLGPETSGLVLTGGNGPIAPRTCSGVVKRFAVAAGVPALTPHVLRHSCITWLVERGVPLPVVQRFAGHGSIDVTMRYAHVAPDTQADILRSALGESRGGNC